MAIPLALVKKGSVPYFSNFVRGMDPGGGEDRADYGFLKPGALAPEAESTVAGLAATGYNRSENAPTALVKKYSVPSVPIFRVIFTSNMGPFGFFRNVVNEVQE